MGIILLSAYGPYIGFPGVRTEQVAVYCAFLLCLAAGRWTRIRLQGSATVVIGLMCVQAVIALANPVVNSTSYGVARTVLAGADNIILPLAVLFIILTLVDSESNLRCVLVTASSVLIVCSCINVMLALHSLLYGHPSILELFWSNDSAETTTAELAETTGRFSGIFGHPAEAGEVYSITMLAAINLFRHRPLVLAATEVIIILGGLLSLSKIFIFVGLPLAVWQTMRTQNWRRPSVLAAVPLVGLILLTFRYIDFSHWGGARTASKFLNPDTSG
ncbi:MAG: hypothetical protein JXA67_05750, partial [Micromonosporaceae bacterium]|nr:hypothetical protein [Micromonosporaceae bacterium]